MYMDFSIQGTSAKEITAKQASFEGQSKKFQVCFLLSRKLGMDFECRGDRYDSTSKDHISEIPKGSQDCQGRRGGSL